MPARLSQLPPRVQQGHGILGVLAGASVAIAPATGHQLELSVDDNVFAFNLEPPGFFLHRWTPDSGMTTQLAMIDRYPGPYDFPWRKSDQTTG